MVTRKFNTIRLPMLVLVAAATTLLHGCKDLAEHGVNTINCAYGVESHSMFGGPPVVDAVVVKCTNDKPYTNARVDLEIVMENGDVLKKSFHAGTLEPNKEWVKKLDKPLARVSAITFRITTEEGAGKGTLDIKNANWQTASRR